MFRVLALIIISTSSIQVVHSGCPFLNKDGSADSAVFESLLRQPSHQHGRRLREETDVSVTAAAAAAPPPPPPPGKNGSPPPGPPPRQTQSPVPSTATTLHPTAPKPPPKTRPPSSLTTLHPTAARPTVTPTMLSQTSATPSFRATLAPVATNVGYVAPFCLKTQGATVSSSKTGTCSAYKFLNSSLPSVVSSFTNNIDLAHFYGATVRLAFHDAGEVDITKTDLLGPDGCLQNVNTNNAGLLEITSPVFTTIEPLWQSVCDKITRADFWALLGKAVVEKSAGKNAPISISYQYGRKDNTICSAGAGRLPKAQGGSSTIQQVFVTQMGLTLDDAVTLIGAHTLGHVHTENSGYGLPNANTNILTNAWDATPTVFDNQYYKSLLNVGWNWQQPDGPTKSLFTTPANQVMLGTDMVLGYPANTAAVVGGNIVGTPGQHCGPASTNPNPAPYGCNAPTFSTPATTPPSTFALATSYANNNALFLSNFATAYTKMTTVGYGVPAKSDGSTSTGKLGTLTSIDFTTC